MDLMSDLCKNSWENKGIPSEDRKTLTSTGYASYNIFRRAPSDEKDDCMKYYLSSDAGVPCQGVLYGASRDPLKSIGHCYMKVKEIKDSHVIIGIIVEDDWVEMKQSFLDTIHVPEPVKKEVNEVDLSIGGDLDLNKWEKKGVAPKIKSDKGYVFYNLLRDHPETKGDILMYYLSTDDGNLLQADLHAAKRDPLKSISHCYLKIAKDGANNKITGIIVEDDWVELK
ncbi:uncharacterized protein LOC130628945 [Hydractinia symbiolongicarpus]|uniref:uncharacterized protein LOC130628945 n=1 Tax=Hydractinia symbiolongicarpus TaxID=13093 RepID=UPI002551784B|nr:uncharacterized protein LOC130628945 [Hydractinia symbiolongicarpus]